MTTILHDHPDADVFAAVERFHMLFMRWRDRIREDQDYRDEELDDLIDDLTEMKPKTSDGWVAMGGAVAAWHAINEDGGYSAKCAWLTALLNGMRAAAGQVTPPRLTP